MTTGLYVSEGVCALVCVGICESVSNGVCALVCVGIYVGVSKGVYIETRASILLRTIIAVYVRESMDFHLFITEHYKLQLRYYLLKI